MTRKEIVSWAKDALPTLASDDTAAFDLPGKQPSNRIAYQAVNGVAYRVFGPGMYRLKSLSGGIAVTRLSVKRPSPLKSGDVA